MEHSAPRTSKLLKQSCHLKRNKKCDRIKPLGSRFDRREQAPHDNRLKLVTPKRNPHHRDSIAIPTRYRIHSEAPGTFEASRPIPPCTAQSGKQGGVTGMRAEGQSGEVCSGVARKCIPVLKI